MLHLIPASLHRVGLRAAHAARTRWWRLAGARPRGVIVIALDGAGQVLLVRHSYGRGLWSLPGGGLRAGEEPLDAARREFVEELDCALHAPSLLGLHRDIFHGAPVVRHVFSGRVCGTPRPDGREIIEARFFARQALPDDCGELTVRLLSMLEQR